MKTQNLLMVAIAVFGMATIASAQVPNYVPTNGLVGWWPFNGNANDESGNGNNGTVNGATLTTDRFGAVDKAYDFDGVDDFIQILDTPSLRLQQATINCWVKYSSMNKMQLFVKQNINNAWDSNYGIEINDYNQILGPGPRIHGMYVVGCGLQTAWTTFTPGNDLSGTVWHQLTAVFDVGIMKIYIDGILMGSLNTPISSMNACAGSDLLLGRGWQNFPLWYSGRIDDLAIWNLALTQQEITALYNSTLGLPVSINENSVKLYPNPTNGTITLEVSSELVGKRYSIRDFSGRIILNGKITSTQEQIDLQGVARGVYYLSIENGSSVIKLVKQ